MSNWFTSLANQAIQIADSFADSLEQISNNAQEELRNEQAKLINEELLKQQQLNKNQSQLPWETNVESLQILCDDLMDSILKLSLNEKNFTCTSINSNDVNFNFSDFIATAMHLLKVDTNLAHIHTRISPKMDEETFWRNYYCRVIFLRAKSGIDGNDAKINSSQYDETKMIFRPSDSGPTNNSGTVSQSEINSMQQIPASFTTDTSSSKHRPSNTLTSSKENLANYKMEFISKEFNNKNDDDIDLADLDDLDMNGFDEGDLAGIDDTSFEEIDKEQYDSNDELEAQIALELAQGDNEN